MAILEARNLQKYFPMKKGLFGGGEGGSVRAVDDISFDI